MTLNKIVNVSVFLTVLCVLALGSGCGRKPGENEVLARVGSAKITLADFNERIANLPERYQAIINSRKEEFLQELINDILLYNEAAKRGLQKNKDVLKVVEEARKKIVIARYLKDSVDDTIKITDEDVADYYNANMSKFMYPEVMRVSHILVPTQAEADKIFQEVKAGASFEDVAKAKSVDPTAQNGGDIGYFPKGQLIPEFEAACAQLEIGGVSPPVKTKLGYHVIKLTDRKPPAPRPLEQIKEQIKSAIQTMDRQEKFGELLTALRAKAKIVINDKLLKEEPQTAAPTAQVPAEFTAGNTGTAQSEGDYTP